MSDDLHQTLQHLVFHGELEVDYDEEGNPRFSRPARQAAETEAVYLFHWIVHSYHYLCVSTSVDEARDILIQHVRQHVKFFPPDMLEIHLIRLTGHPDFIATVDYPVVISPAKVEG